MRTVFLHLLAVGVSASLSAQSIPTSSNLPIVVIKTNGQAIVDEPKIMADMGIIYNGPGIRNYLTDPYTEYDGKIGIEIRGNSSQTLPEKKSFGFETRNPDGSNNNVPLLGLPEENDWILFSGFDDETYMRDVLAYDLSRGMGRYASRTVYVEVFITADETLEYDDYRGVYVFMEKLKRDKDRIDIAKLRYEETSGDDLTGGYIVKIDAHVGSQVPYWASQYPNECGDFRTDFELDEPDEELHPAHLSYIQDFLHGFESALIGPSFTDTTLGYRKYADAASFIDYFLLSEVMRSTDAYSYSTYMHKDKDSKGGKLVMGPVWDYNYSSGNTPYNWCAANDTVGWQYQSHRLCRVDRKSAFWWKRLLDDPAYVAALQVRWNALRSGVLRMANVTALLDQYRAVIAEAQPREYERWNVMGEQGGFAAEIAYLKDWLDKRMQWMDRNVPLLGNYIHLVDSTPPITCEQPVELSAYTGKQLTYQWKLNGNPIMGASGSGITAYEPGTYTVDVTLAGDCYTETLATDPITRVVKSVQNGDWSQASTWSCQTVPTSLDAVIVQSGHAVAIPQSVQASAASLSLETNAQITQQVNASLMLGN